MRALLLFSLFASALADPLAANLVYRSPILDQNIPQLSHNTHRIAKRYLSHARVKAKRQMIDNPGLADMAYPSFYGSNFGTSPFIWNGGVTFTHSVASGDPFDTSVILWTRAVPNGTPDQSVPICVAWEISTSQDLSNPVNKGEAFTSWDVDFTVKVEATKLKPDTHYFFRFADCTKPSSTSPVGKTRTISSANTPASQVNNGKPLVIAVFSCSQFQSGYFNAYGVAAQNTSADIFIHLGDYIYESLGNGAHINRTVQGRELATVHDYRQRYAQYRTDASLVIAHQNNPWIAVWDDHEIADQSWKAGTADANDTSVGCAFSPSGACFTDRKLAGTRAYHEWMPIRQVKADDKLRIFRNFQIGKLADLTMLDTRQYDRDLTDLYYNTEFVNSISSFPNRSLMGADQENWFYDTLSSSKSRGATWRIIGQQIVFTQLNESGSFDVDAWDGYRMNRQRVLNHLYQQRIPNSMILSGDSHANWVSDLAHPNDTSYDPASGKGAIGVEWAGTAVTSGSSLGAGILPAAADKISSVLVAAPSNEELQWSEGSYRGFFTLTINTTHTIANYWAMRNISTPNLDGFVSATFVMKSGDNKLTRPVAGGKVLAGVLKSSIVNGTNSTGSGK